MRIWHLDARCAPVPIPADAVAALLSDAPGVTVAQGIFGLVSRLADIDYLSLVEYRSSRADGVAVPEMAEALARPGIENLAPSCFSLYRRRFWRGDDGTRVANELGRAASPTPVATHLRPEQIGDTAWRQDIYERAHLAGRLNIIYSPVRGRTFAVNLYRDRARGDFAPAEIERLLGTAVLIRQAHRCLLCSRAPECSSLPAAERVRLAERDLRDKAPQLSPREIAVCARIACGLSADGIAADLGIGVSTVATLRKRAYAKLADAGIVGGRLRLAAELRR